MTPECGIGRKVECRDLWHGKKLSPELTLDGDSNTP